MAVYMNWHSLASTIKNLEYSNKHTSSLNNPDEVNRRIEALEFWRKHGLSSAIDHAGVSRSTLYSWRNKLDSSRKRDRMGRAGLKALDPKSTRPKRCRQSNWDKEMVKLLVRLATKHPELGRQPLYYMLRRRLEAKGWLDKLVSISTVGRILCKLRQSGKLPSKIKLSLNGRTGRLYEAPRRRTAKLRRGALPYKIKQPGDLVQVDGVEGYHLGRHYYVINAIDYISGKATSTVLANKSSLSTANFLRELDTRLGFRIKAIQTDNGSEYAAKFHQAAERLGIKHCFNYVKKPIYNGKVERFNRTIQEAIFQDEDFLVNLVEDKQEANRTIESYLDFYNNERPHMSLGFMTPTEFLLQYSQRNSKVQNVVS